MDMDRMGPTARKRKAHIHGLSIACILAAAPVLNAFAQIPPSGGGTIPGATSNEPRELPERGPWFIYGVDAGIGESDNVTLAPTNKIHQTVATTDVDLVIKGKSRLLEADVTGDFSYLDYLQNAFRGQVLGRLDGLGKLAIVPERLLWVLQDDFGQAAVDPYTAVTPSNLENINYFSTGPTLLMRVGAVNFIDLEGRYGRAQYETSPYTSNRGLGSLAVGREIAAGASVSLNAEFERVMFENTVVNADFDRISGFGRYKVHGARTDLDVDLGASRIKQGGVSTSKPLAKLQLSRELSAAAELTLAAGSELTDALTSFSTLQSATVGPNAIIGTATPALTSSNYTSDYASAGWRYRRNRTTLTFTVRWEKDTYSGQPQFDSNRSGADFDIRRQLTRAFSADLFGRYYRTDYTNVVVASSTSSSKYNDWLVEGALTWRYGRGLEVRLRYDHNSRVVSAGGSGYSENRVFLTVGYRPIAATQLAEPR